MNLQLPSPTAPADEKSDEYLAEELATKVMGWTKIHDALGTLYTRDGVDLFDLGTWRPLEDWNDTMEVARKVTNAFGIMILLTHHEGTAQIIQAPLGDYRKIEVTDASPQRAICLAALQAVQPAAISHKKP